MNREQKIDMHLAMFAKYWEPGLVKTRLGKSIGTLSACEIHRLFVSHLSSRLGACFQSQSVAFSPESRRCEFRAALTTTWDLIPQSNGDLGDRMLACFGHYLRSHSKVAIIGSDSPHLPIGFLEQTALMLEQHRVVLGPSEDGGYYLIAMQGEPVNIFDGVDWGTPSVFQQTIDQLEMQGIPFGILPTFYDIDHLTDLERLQRELQQGEQPIPLRQLSLEINHVLTNLPSVVEDRIR